MKQNAIKPWLGVSGEIKRNNNNSHDNNSVVGVMYTTWSGNYDALETFAGAAWGQ